MKASREQSATDWLYPVARETEESRWRPACTGLPPAIGRAFGYIHMDTFRLYIPFLPPHGAYVFVVPCADFAGAPSAYQAHESAVHRPEVHILPL